MPKQRGYIVFAKINIDGVDTTRSFFRGSEDLSLKLIKKLKDEGYSDMRYVSTDKMKWCSHCQKTVEVKDGKDEASGEPIEQCSRCGREIDEEW